MKHLCFLQHVAFIRCKCVKRPGLRINYMMVIFFAAADSFDAFLSTAESHKRIAILHGIFPAPNASIIASLIC